MDRLMFLRLILVDGKVPPGYTEICCHMIFDIKMDFTTKARFVAGGHLTDPPKDSVYSSVVTRESVRLFFLIAALNDLDVLACDVQNVVTCKMHTSMVYDRLVRCGDSIWRTL
jgi:hypothetical protein